MTKQYSTQFYSNHDLALSKMQSVYEQTGEKVYLVERQYGPQGKYSEFSIRTHSQMFFPDIKKQHEDIFVEPEAEIEIPFWKRTADYSDFFLNNNGFSFKSTDTGAVLSKLQIFIRLYRGDNSILYNLTENNYPGWNRVSSINSK